MAAAMTEVCNDKREFYFFDSFSGLPNPGKKDGKEALDWKENVHGERYFNNCTASVVEFKETVEMSFTDMSLINVVKGSFCQTLFIMRDKNVAILRMDADWYDSTMSILDMVWDRVVPGGIVIIDDYLDWKGCRKAVHDFLSKRDLAEAIRETMIGEVFYIVKLPLAA